jgi:hypothetical protein
VSGITRSDVVGHAHAGVADVRFHGKEKEVMRKTLFWIGWAILFAIPLAAGAEIYLMKDLPDLNAWKLGLLVGAVLLVIFSRNRDEVLKHKLV